MQFCLSQIGEHRNKPLCFSTTVSDNEHKLTCSWDFGMLGFSDFDLTFSLGFVFESLPALRNFMVAAACLRMQSLLQYTESGWATLKQPGPMHFDAPGVSITYRLKQSKFKLQKRSDRKIPFKQEELTYHMCRPQLWLSVTCTIAACSWDTTSNPHKYKDFTPATVFSDWVVFSSDCSHKSKLMEVDFQIP